MRCSFPKNVKFYLCPVFLDYFTVLFTRYFIVRFMYEDNVGPTRIFFLVISITLSFQIKKFKFQKSYLYDTVPVPPFLLGDNFWPHILKRGIRKKWVPGGLKEFLPLIFVLEGGAYYVSCQKKTFKSKIWLWGLNFECSLVLANQPINV